MAKMHGMHNLRGIDLNLLVILAALLEERHVSRAAGALNMSQPAVSHALGRLRALLGDPLLVRAAGGWRLTARAREIEPQLRSMIETAKAVLGVSAFEPAKARRAFRLGMSDYGSAVVLPRLAAVLRAAAPGIELRIGQHGREETMRRLDEGLLDAALGVFPRAEPPLRLLPLFRERFVCVADPGHPALSPSLSLESYLGAAHVSVSMQGEPDGEVEAALKAIGRTRRVALVLPHFVSALHLLPGTDLMLTIAERTLEVAPAPERLAVREPPFAISAFAFGLITHRRTEREPGMDWFTSLVTATCGEPM